MKNELSQVLQRAIMDEAIDHSLQRVMRQHGVDLEGAKRMAKWYRGPVTEDVKAVSSARLVKIKSAPGARLLPFVRFCYSAKNVQRIFEPIYADFCEEYFAALSAGKKWHAHWIRVRYYKDFVKAVGLFGVVRLAKTVFEYWEKIA